MGPVNLAKIKAAHHKLMKLDPDFNSRAQKIKRSSELWVFGLKDAHVSDASQSAILAEQDQEIDDLFASFGPGEMPKRVVTKPQPKVLKKKTSHYGKRATRYEVGGEKLTLGQLSMRAGVKPHTILSRLRQGFSIDEAVDTPKGKLRKQGERKCSREPCLYTYNGKSLSLTGWSLECGIPPNTLDWRIRKGWTIDRALTTPSQGKRESGGWVKTSSESIGTAATPSLDIAAKQEIFQ